MARQSKLRRKRAAICAGGLSVPQQPNSGRDRRNHRVRVVVRVVHRVRRERVICSRLVRERTQLLNVGIR